jgi:putative heme-binding domain-containing protein
MLSGPAYRQQVTKATRDPDANIRLGAIMALQRSGFQQAEPVLRRLLADPDLRIRQRALIWTGQAGLMALKSDIDRALSAGPATAALFETYLETVSHLEPEYIQAYRTQAASYAKSIKRELPSGFVESFVHDNSRSAGLRAMAVRHLHKPSEQTNLLLSVLNTEKDEGLRMEVLRSLAEVPGEDIARQLLRVASASLEPVPLRTWAILALARQPLDVSEGVIPLLQDPDMNIRIEAARYLRTRLANKDVKQIFEQLYDSLESGKEEPLKEQMALALSITDTSDSLMKRPSTVEEWQQALARGGEPGRGLRVMYSMQSMCTMCHAVEGRGGDLGTELTNSGKSKTRTQLVHSILRPSGEVSPEYQGWYVRLKNGEVYQGRQIDVGDRGIELYTQGRGFVTFDKKDIEDYGMSEKSLMPEGLENQLTVSDLRDLIAFLEEGISAGTGKKELTRVKSKK